MSNTVIPFRDKTKKEEFLREELETIAFIRAATKTRYRGC
jgi:hypothetical protein